VVSYCLGYIEDCLAMIVCLFFLDKSKIIHSRWKILADEIGFYVQQYGGSFHTVRHGVEFVIPKKHQIFLKIKFPELEEVNLIC
jgi:hypothetical protein